MDPDPDQHDSFFMVEPRTSIPVKVKLHQKKEEEGGTSTYIKGANGSPVEYQAGGQSRGGVRIQGYHKHVVVQAVEPRCLQDLATAYLPVLWFQSSAQLPDGMASSLVGLVNLPTIMVGGTEGGNVDCPSFQATASGVGIVLGMAVILYSIRSAR